MAEILIVDDSWLTCRGLCNMIFPHAHGVFAAESLREGRVQIGTYPPDCVFLDLPMLEKIEKY